MTSCARLGEGDLLERHDLGGGAGLQAQGVAQAAAGEHQRVGGLGGHQVGGHLGPGHHGDAGQLQLALQVGVEVAEVLVRALDGVGEGEKAAQHAVPLVERDLVAAQRRDAGALHAGGAAAHDHDALGVARQRGQPEALGHLLAEGALRAGVDAAVLDGAALQVHVEVAVHAAGARGDLVDAALAQLVDVVGVHGERAVHD